KMITSVPGASDVFDFGVVTYSNPVKFRVLGVSESTLADKGAVSKECVREMARGAMALSHADIAVSVSGIAGPEGGSEDKPVGLVWFGLRVKRNGKAVRAEYPCLFRGDRARIQLFASLTALDLMRLAAEDATSARRRDVAFLAREYL
ncbi:MAG: CinA family protein, partial [Planctomycetes bacterium]|nr:CinA family protein [Planctomycetota bacterium]